MNNMKIKKIFILIFMIMLLFILITQLMDNITKIKQQSENIKIEKVNHEYEFTSNWRLHRDIREYWIPIERKDSYNNELQYYSRDNVFFDEDAIEIISKKETKEDKEYTSGLVESSCAYKYGYFEFTIEISQGKGIFPAIWLLPEEDKGLPEIDIFEMIGSQPYTFYGVIHYEQDGDKKSDYFAHEVPVQEKYVVALEWGKDRLIWYIDGNKIYETESGVPQEYMYLIINQAVGGDWPGNPDDKVFPSRFKVQSITIKPMFMKGRG